MVGPFVTNIKVLLQTRLLMVECVPYVEMGVEYTGGYESTEKEREE